MRITHRQMYAYFDMEGRPGCCNWCDLLILKTIIMGMHILIAIAGCFVMGIGLVMHGTEIFLPEVIEQYEPELRRISLAMIIIGAAIAALCVFGCVSTASGNRWYTILYLLCLTLCLAAQLSYGLLTLFLRKEVRQWAYHEQNTSCQDCVPIYEKVMTRPTIAAMIMCSTVTLQLCIVICMFLKYRMTTAAKGETVTAELMNDEQAEPRDDVRIDLNSNMSNVQDAIDTGDLPSSSHLLINDAYDVRYDTSPTRSNPHRPSTSPAKLPIVAGVSEVGVREPIPEDSQLT